MSFLKTNMEKKTRIYLGIFTIAMLVVYLIANLTTINWIKWTGIILGFFLVAILIIEAGIREYLHTKAYKSISWKDIVVVLTVIVAIGVLMNTLLMFNIVGESVPEALLNFSKMQGSIITIGAILLSILHIFTPRFK